MPSSNWNFLRRKSNGSRLDLVLLCARWGLNTHGSVEIPIGNIAEALHLLNDADLSASVSELKEPERFTGALGRRCASRLIETLARLYLDLQKRVARFQDSNDPSEADLLRPGGLRNRVTGNQIRNQIFILRPRSIVAIIDSDGFPTPLFAVPVRLTPLTVFACLQIASTHSMVLIPCISTNGRSCFKPNEN